MVVAEAMGRAGGGTPNRVRVSGFGAAVGGGGLWRASLKYRSGWREVAVGGAGWEAGGGGWAGPHGQRSSKGGR
jgi:hypothetical protein